MLALFKEIMERFCGGELREVYPSFDAVPFDRKSDRLFTVLAPESVQFDAPFPQGGEKGALPFSLVCKVSVLTPMQAPVSVAEAFFYTTVLPRMEALGSVLCEVAPPQVDIRLGRVVLEGKFRLRGVYFGEEET